MAKHILPALILTGFLASCSGSDSTPVGTDSSKHDSVPVVAAGGDSSSIGGVYAFGTDPDREAVGSVIIYPESDSTFLFDIDFNRGAPSYNMGLLEGRGKIIGDTG